MLQSTDVGFAEFFGGSARQRRRFVKRVRFLDEQPQDPKYRSMKRYVIERITVPKIGQRILLGRRAPCASMRRAFN